MAQMQSDRPPRPMKVDPLSPVLERLGQALAAAVPGQEAGWAAEVDAALAALEQALCRHETLAVAPDGMLNEVDLTRPTLVRQVSEVRRQHADLLTQTGDLQQLVRRAIEAFQTPPTQTASALPEPARGGPAADFGDLRRRGEELVAALRRHQQAEIDLTQESVTTDIGVGD